LTKIGGDSSSSSPSRIFGAVTKFFGGRSSPPDDMKRIQVALEGLCADLEKTLHTLSKYSDEDKKISRLTLEVKIALKACSDWADQIEQRRISSTLLADIEGKAKSLGFAISNEVLEQTLRIQRKQDELKKIQSLSLKKPLEYYADGKYLITEKKWYEAKEQFLFYRNFVLQGTPVSSKDGDGGIRSPKEDSHLKYLAHVESQLSEVENNPLFTQPLPGHSAPKKKSEYEVLWEKWEATHMGKK